MSGKRRDPIEVQVRGVETWRLGGWREIVLNSWQQHPHKGLVGDLIAKVFLEGERDQLFEGWIPFWEAACD